MAHSEQFHNGAGFDLHVRTTIDSFYSYIEGAAVRIGDHILEVSADKTLLDGHQMDLPVEFMSADGQHTYKYHMTSSQMGGQKKLLSLDADGKSRASSRNAQRASEFDKFVPLVCGCLLELFSWNGGVHPDTDDWGNLEERIGLA